MIVYDDHLDLEMESFKEIILSRIKLFNKKEGMRLLIRLRVGYKIFFVSD